MEKLIKSKCLNTVYTLNDNIYRHNPLKQKNSHLGQILENTGATETHRTELICFIKTSELIF